MASASPALAPEPPLVRPGPLLQASAPAPRQVLELLSEPVSPEPQVLAPPQELVWPAPAPRPAQGLRRGPVMVRQGPARLQAVPRCWLQASPG